jgi:[acyl-carrier-protein] S-malonyltransferase
MKQAGERSPGGMAAIMGLDIPTLDQICSASSSQSEVVQVANDNCPGQVVISGAKAALDRALQLATSSGARRAIPLAVSIAAHSPLMEFAQADFNQAVNAAPISSAAVPLVGNVTARPLESPDDIRTDLRNQLTHRVRWTESVQFMVSQGVQRFIEIGSGSVLIGLVRRIVKDVEGLPAGKPEDAVFNSTV